MNELIINGQDAYTTYGIRMGKGFIDALTAPASVKDYVENKSRLNHGKKVLVSNVRLDEREVTLIFNVHGKTAAEFKTHKTAFINALHQGAMTVSVPSQGAEVYHLVYKKCTSYAHSISNTFCKVGVKFEEPNPANR